MHPLGQECPGDVHEHHSLKERVGEEASRGDAWKPLVLGSREMSRLQARGRAGCMMRGFRAEAGSGGNRYGDRPVRVGS